MPRRGFDQLLTTRSKVKIRVAIRVTPSGRSWPFLGLPLPLPLPCTILAVILHGSHSSFPQLIPHVLILQFVKT